MIKPKIRNKRCYNCKFSCMSTNEGMMQCSLKEADIAKDDYCDRWKTSDFSYYCPICDYPLKRLSYTRLWCPECEKPFVDGDTIYEDTEGLRK